MFRRIVFRIGYKTELAEYYLVYTPTGEVVSLVDENMKIINPNIFMMQPATVWSEDHKMIIYCGLEIPHNFFMRNTLLYEREENGKSFNC